MNEAFENLDVEKRDRIINAALEEFGKYPFDKASTNNIVKNAGISKGTLFYYFKNKENLFDYLLLFTIDMIYNEIEDNILWDERDIFERIKAIALFKLKLTERYPHLFAFGKLLYENQEKRDLLLKQKKMIEITAKVYTHNIDYEKFKEEVDIQKAITIIRWSIEKLGEEYMAKIEALKKEVDYDELLAEFDGYSKVLKKAFYK